jgi:hypothetical protein
MWLGAKNNRQSFDRREFAVDTLHPRSHPLLTQTQDPLSAPARAEREILFFVDEEIP